MNIDETYEYLRKQAERLAENNSLFDTIFEEIKSNTKTESSIRVDSGDDKAVQKELDEIHNYFEGKTHIKYMYNVISHAITLQGGSPIQFPENGMYIKCPYNWYNAQISAYKLQHPEMSRIDMSFTDLYPDMMLGKF